MEQTKYDIFISYKRKSLPTANNLYFRLTTRGYSTFVDLEELGRDNFNIQLLNYIENAKDVFVILEEGSLDACKNEDWKDDWFCREIAFALEKKKNIIPILIGGYKMPPKSFFPDELKEFSLKNAPEFNYSFFDAYLDKLVKKDFLLSKPNLKDKATDVLPITSVNKSDLTKKEKQSIIPENITTANKVFDFNIVDEKTPLVIFYGRHGAGKTSIIKSLSHYLLCKGYEVIPNRSFRDTDDYQQLCDRLNIDLQDNDPYCNPTQLEDIVPIIISNNLQTGKRICQLIDTCDCDHPLSEDSYLYKLLSTKNPKILVITIEANAEGHSWRESLVQHIHSIINTKLRGNDEVFIIVNKMDLITHSIARRHNIVNLVETEYPRLLDRFKKNISFLNTYSCSFLPYSAKSYNDGYDGYYQRKLWLAIEKICLDRYTLIEKIFRLLEF